MFFLAQTGRRYAPFTDLAVDLGTANTLVHVRGQGVVVNEPSVVAVNRSSRVVHAVGLEAKRMIGRTTGEIGAVYPLRGGVIADVDLAETMLRGFLRQADERHVVPRERELHAEERSVRGTEHQDPAASHGDLHPCRALPV